MASKYPHSFPPRRGERILLYPLIPVFLVKSLCHEIKDKVKNFRSRRSTKQSTKLSTNQSTNQSTKQPTKQWKYYSAAQRPFLKRTNSAEDLRSDKAPVKRSEYSDRPYAHQPASALLGQCPFEVREQIWRYVLGGLYITLFQGNGRLVHIVEKRECGKWHTFIVKKTNLLALSKTCRQAYAETIGILYKSNKFSLYQNDTLFDLHSTIRQKHFESIRDLEVHWQFRDETFRVVRTSGEMGTKSIETPRDIRSWQKACRLLRGMSRTLENLHIVVRMDTCGGVRAVDIVDMLENLRGFDLAKDNFRVRIPELLPSPNSWRKYEWPFSPYETLSSTQDDGSWAPDVYYLTS